MNINIGDQVIPRHFLGTIVEIQDDQVVIEYRSSLGDVRLSYLTKEQARAKGKTLEKLVEESLIILKKEGND